MSAELIQKLIDAGTPAMLIAEVAMELGRITAEVDVLMRRRANERERKARSRDKTGQNVTERDSADKTSPKVSPNDIYSNPLPTPTASPKASPSPKLRKPTMARPDDADEVVWRDWTQLRAKQGAPPTETAIAGIRREAGKLGWTLNQALAECCERSWRGFKAEWVSNANGRRNGNGIGSGNGLIDAIREARENRASVCGTAFDTG